MIVNVYTIKDSKLETYAQPFFSPTHGSALRAFADHVNETGTAANKHPEDFSLHHIGRYDDNTGQLSSDAVTLLGTALEYKTKAT